MKQKFYLTTPLYYVNDIPHIGHAYTTIAADVLARWKRLAGFDVFFLTGTDEHGMKIATAASEKGTTPKEHVDQMASHFIEVWKKLNISNNDFIRTTQERHSQVVQLIFKKLLAQGDLYKGEYEGWYCVPCETFWTEFQLGGKLACLDCGRPLHKVKEDSYFFKLSKYQNEIKAWIEQNPDFLEPQSRKNEILSFLKEPLKDISFTRTNFTWGIPVPEDENKVIYVWFDALINYISALGYPDQENFNKYWPADVHLIGKEIIRFHAVIWPGILLALGLPLPRKVFAHGWWTVEGSKMSKSKGNVVEPLALCEKFGVDAFRYFILREVPFGADGDFSIEAFKARFNADLANDIGNLLNRSLTMVEKYFSGVIPEVPKDVFGGFEQDLIDLAKRTPAEVSKRMAELNFSEALSLIWKLVNKANSYIEKKAPWIISKEGKTLELAAVIYNLIETQRIIAILVSPFMPQTSQQIWHQLGLSNFEKQSLTDLEWGKAAPGTKINKGFPLFPRLL